MMKPAMFEVLHKVRERREKRVRQEWVACREAERKKQMEADRARTVLDEQRGLRDAFAAKLTGSSGATSVADQLVGRACLLRMEQEVKRCQTKVAEADAALAKAQEVTRAARQRLNAATAAKDKMERCMEKSEETEMRERIGTEEAELDDDTETMTGVRFSLGRQ